MQVIKSMVVKVNLAVAFNTYTSSETSAPFNVYTEVVTLEVTSSFVSHLVSKEMHLKYVLTF